MKHMLRSIKVGFSGGGFRTSIIRSVTDEHVTATGFPRLGFHFGRTPITYDGSINHDASRSRAVIIGQKGQAAQYFTGEGGIESFVVEFEPILLRSLAGISDASQLTNRRVALDQIFGREAEIIFDRLASIKQDEEKISLIIEWIRSHSNSNSSDLIVRRALHIIRLHNGNINISKLADKLSVSIRTIEKKFLREIGLNIKHYARLVRCQYANKLISMNQKMSTLALMAGYADQSHFNKEYKKLIGMTPSKSLEAGYPSRINRFMSDTSNN